MNLKGSDFNFTKSSFNVENKEPFFFHQVLPFVMWGSRKHLEDPFVTMESDPVYAPPPSPIFCLLVQAQASVHFLLTLYQSFPSTMNRLLWASCSRKWGHMWDDPPPFGHVYCDRKKEKKIPGSMWTTYAKNHLKSKETGEGAEEGLWVVQDGLKTSHLVSSVSDGRKA